MEAIATTIFAGLETLAQNPVIRSLIAENIGTGGVERLVQDSLLWAINSSANAPVLASSDKRVPIGDPVPGKKRSGEKEVDLVFFPRSPSASADWWRLWDVGDGTGYVNTHYIYDGTQIVLEIQTGSSALFGQLASSLSMGTGGRSTPGR